MRAVLEAAGVEFTNGDEPGVKLNARGRASNSAAGSAKGTERPVYRSIKSVKPVKSASPGGAHS